MKLQPKPNADKACNTEEILEVREVSLIARRKKKSVQENNYAVDFDEEIPLEPLLVS